MLNRLDLLFVEHLITGCYHREGSGRPPRNPLGLFKAHLARRFLRISSLRELEHRLQIDEQLRTLCNIDKDEPAYGRSVLSRFNQKLGTERLRHIVNNQVRKLIRRHIVEARTVALDATFIKAYSRRNMDNQTGYSDPESRVGRAYRSYGLGYKLHMAVDADSGTPLAYLVAPANANEKRLSISLLNKTVKLTDTQIQQLTADSQYSSRDLRETAEDHQITTAIPYPTNQKLGNPNILRITKDFKTHGPEHLKRIYRKRSMIELVFAWLKEHLNLNNHKVRGLKDHNPHLLLNIMSPLHYRSLTQPQSSSQITKHNILGEPSMKQTITGQACALRAEKQVKATFR